MEGLIQNLFDFVLRALESGEGPIGMIISPTRELCQQIYYETKKFFKSCGLRVAAIFGGVPVSEQIACLKRRAECIVTKFLSFYICFYSVRNTAVQNVKVHDRRKCSSKMPSCMLFVFIILEKYGQKSVCCLWLFQKS